MSKEEKKALEQEESVQPEGTPEPQEVKILTEVDKAKVEKLIHQSVYASMGVGVTLLPFVNLAGVTALQLNMIRKLSQLYGVEFKENIAKKILTAVVASGASVLATGPVGMLALSIPVFGTAAAFATLPTLNGISTLAMGRMFVTHFERGGNFIDANMDSMKEDFKTAYQNSREQLGDMISGKKAAAESR